MNDHEDQSPAEVYETLYVPAMFGPLADVVVGRADPRPGERALDVACGTGAVARRIAPRVGSEGAVVGIDRSPAMIAAAKRRPPPAGATITWIEGNATRLDLPDRTFDLVVCQQGLQFFEDRPGALREARRVLAEGGRLCLAVWKSLDHHPLWRAMAEVEAGHLEPLGFSFADLIAPFSLGDAELIAALVEEAGLGSVAISSHDVSVRFPAEDFVARTEKAYAAVVPQFAADPAAFAAFVENVSAEVAPILERFRDGAELRFDMPTHVFLARA